MIKKLIFTLVLITFINKVFAHPHHHSLAIFDYNKETGLLELSFKVLSEDYKKIAKEYRVEDYINKHLKLYQDKNELSSDFQGMEATVDYIWLYFTYKPKPKAFEKTTQIKVYNSILLHFNKNQFNTVKLNVSNQHYSHNFSSIEKRHTFIMQ